LLAVLGLSYMLCKNQNLHLAEETHKLQLQLDSLDRSNQQLSSDLNTMKSPERLVRRLAQMRSNLVRLSDGNFEIIPIDSQQIRARLAAMGTLPQGGINLNVAQTAPADPSSR